MYKRQDVSDSIKIFSHLELDEDYALYCYISHEYHGLWGRVAAIKKTESTEPIIKADDPLRMMIGPTFELPDSSVHPMEAIYHDGTPYGYFEALLAAEFYGALPYVRFEQDNWDRCIMDQPDRFYAEWIIHEHLPDWRPQLIKNRFGDVKIMMCWLHPENGIGSSNGCDVIRRSHHEFYPNAGWNSHRKDVYKSHVDREKQRDDQHRCCLASQHSITIAIQKDWKTLAKQSQQFIMAPSEYNIRL